MAKKTQRFSPLLLALIGGALLIIPIIVLCTSLSLPAKLLARVPKSVGNRAAPIPQLTVDMAVAQFKRNLTSSQVISSIRSSVGGRGVRAKFALKEYQLLWRVSVEDGTMAPVTAQVFVPVPTDQQTDFPVIVYGPGSTGLADRCAPSLENLARGNMGNYRNYMISEASQGYIVIMPNYEGFDNPYRNQHYFNRDSEARSMLSAARALYQAAPGNQLPVKPDSLFFGGYSQGGHAAFSAADYAGTYTPDMKVSGVFGHGPTTDIVEYLIHNPNLAAYFVASYSEYYPAIKPAEILEPKWIEYLDRARKICVDEGFGINSTSVAAVFADPFQTALVNKTLATDFPHIDQIFAENNAGTSYNGIPTMIVQGTTDPVVTEKAQDEFVAQLCARNVPVDLKKYPGLHHFSTRQTSFHDTNRWIEAIVAGQSVNNSCLNI